MDCPFKDLMIIHEKTCVYLNKDSCNDIEINGSNDDSFCRGQIEKSLESEDVRIFLSVMSGIKQKWNGDELEECAMVWMARRIYETYILVRKD